jgi:cytidylate kinase
MAVIAFSREAHSGTRDLARQLAGRLGYRYVSRDEVTKVVKARTGLDRVPQAVESEGRALSIWEMLGEQFTGDRETYVSALKAVITDLALQDNVIIVGHGAGLFLRDVPTAIRVLVVAPVEHRVERLLEEGTEDAASARKIVDKQDRESGAYLRYLFGINWQDPHEWDLVINTGRTSMQATLDMLTNYAQSLVRSLAEETDLRLRQTASRVESALLGDETLGVDKLLVAFDDNRLVLRGEALAEEDRARAEATARELAPGATIDNKILLHPPTSS